MQEQLDRLQWSGADFERETKISRSRLNSWKAGGAPTPELVVTCARAFGVKPVEAFIYAGWLDPVDAVDFAHFHADIAVFSNQALLREIARRLEGEYRVPVATPTAKDIEAHPERYSVVHGGMESDDHSVTESSPQDGG